MGRLNTESQKHAAVADFVRLCYTYIATWCGWLLKSSLAHPLYQNLPNLTIHNFIDWLQASHLKFGQHKLAIFDK